MSVNCKLRVESPSDPTVFFEMKKSFNSRDDARKLLEGSYGTFQLFQYILPLRTHSVSKFLEDLFIPGLLSDIQNRTNSVAGRVISTVILDIVFLPVRLITALPWVIYNSVTYKEPALLVFLKSQQNVDSRLLKAESVKVHIRSERAGRSVNPAYTLKKYVNFMNVPYYHGCHNYEENGSFN